MPAAAGIQGREGMDTGFRRYDETFVPNRRVDPAWRCIFEGGHSDRRGFKITFSVFSVSSVVTTSSEHTGTNLIPADTAMAEIRSVRFGWR